MQGSVNLLAFPKRDPTNDNFATSGTASQTGGLDIDRTVATTTINATVVKASAGRVYHVYVYTTNATTARFLKIYDKATAPDPSAGVDVPLLVVLAVPNAIHGYPITFPHGLGCANGISFVCVSGAGDTDETVLSAADTYIHVGYK